MLVVKSSLDNTGEKRHRFDPWVVRKIPWRRAWQSTLAFLSGESHGQRSLEGYMGSPRVGHDRKNSASWNITLVVEIQGWDIEG